MVCKVRYLNSAGIHHREVKGVSALAIAFPSNWLMYASLNAFPANSAPIEIDLLIVMDDRVLLLELKDWNGPLKAKGDMWIHGRPQRSPVQLGAEKARKIKGILKNQIPNVGKTYVDSRVVLTGTSTRDLLPTSEQPSVLTLEEAKLLADKKERDRLLGPVTLMAFKPNMLVKEFDRVLGNPAYFQALKMSWDGYNVTDENFFVHRKDIWREHRAQLGKEERVKALLRLFRFNNLPVGLNHPTNRELIADRELRTIGYLSENASWMAERGILKSVGAAPAEVLTEHYQLLQIPAGWTTLRRYIARNGSDIRGEQRIDIAHSLAEMVAELHDRGVAHRDIGDDAIWLGAPTSMSLTGFFSAKLPDEESVSDHLEVIGTYAQAEPHWDGTVPTAQQRDVRSVGLIMQDLAQIEGELDALPPGWAEIASKAVSAPSERYANARELTDALGDLRTPSGPTVDQSQLDQYETKDIPYVVYPARGPMANGKSSTRYESFHDPDRVLVKVWNGVVRGDAHRDHALLNTLEAAATLKAVPQVGIASVLASGLSPVGPFVVTRYVEGTPLGDWKSDDTKELLGTMSHLSAAVSGLHARGLAHGDLRPDNVIVGTDGSVTLIDLLDIPALGNERIRSPEWAPADFERKSDQEIDRFAVCRIVLKMVEGVPDTGLQPIADAAQKELDRHTIETLDPLLDAIVLEQERRAGPPPMSFKLSFPSVASEDIAGDDGYLWVKAFKTASGVDVFWLTGLQLKLLLRMAGDDVDHLEISEATFADLGRGQRVGITVSTQTGPSAGAFELANFLRTVVPVKSSSIVAVTEDEAPEVLDGPEIPSTSDQSSKLDLRRLWVRSAELEEESVLKVRIDRRIPDLGNSATYNYESSRPLEFEDDDTVEVRLGGLSGRFIGYLDIPNCDSRRLAVRDLRSPVSEGEFVALIDRRDRVSKERRRRAVERITRGSSVIPNLIDYFDPDKDLPDERFALPETTDQLPLSTYNLNQGQQRAFKSLFEIGPIGLLQGPPGSGKTRFIASLVHWLLEKAGAQRVLIASQSHEAVNNVLEELLQTFKRHKGYADLLRVGSRGATERIRPYQARSLRDRHRVRFENGIKTRVAHAASAVGIPKQFVHDIVEVDLKLGKLARAIELAEAAASGDAVRDERRRSDSRMRSLLVAFYREASTILGREVDSEFGSVATVLSEAYSTVQAAHPKVPAGDLITTQRLVTLANEWKDTLSSGHRNFDEFLAKTRRVVAGTCVGLGQSQIRLEHGTFDWVIVDEAARCTSGELAVPLQLGSRAILVGDQLQLRPMVDRQVQASLEEEFEGAGTALGQTDFERAFASSYGRRNAQVLDEQYRMVSVISDLVSETFYAPHGVQLRPSSDRVPDKAFTSLPDDLTVPVVWFDTSKMEAAKERDRNDGRDIWNDAEINTVISLLHRLAKEEELVDTLSRRSAPAIGVICMYSEQKRRIEREWSQQPFPELFRRMVVIDTVDAYQGKENEIVILSLVRSNDEKAAGHVRRPNRCNVAMSRAKERLYIVGDTTMWSSPKCASPMRTVLSKIQHMDATDGKVRASSEIGQ
ncbi:AAA domain-containing protein [Rhizobium leguminosarum]|uniref:AAA domain-containing protein n=1 Tax=Rhizobium leguminosarum TaxID=384 RepID=UPI003F9EB07C